DSDSGIFPGASEVCDGLDNDCNGSVPGTEIDVDGDGQAACEGDCDESSTTRYLGAPELCNGIDDDCNSSVPSNEIDGDGDGEATCEGDCDDSDVTTYSAAPELCDGIDNDCNGVIDDNAGCSGGNLGPISFDLGLGCGYNLNSNNNTPIHNNDTDGYPACGLPTLGWGAGEFVGVIGQAGDITLNLSWSNPAIDLDLIVISSGDVVNSTCYGSSTSSSGTSESVFFNLAPGNVAYIAIDGKGGDSSSFDLSISCP
ncbi:MAG: putative metal-binding motif-containing protein, partial [Deltaproteobacteria bacterium]|nr:putative metal-binding motif-containing protein [Deltaproteobacteria bacterium]